MWKRLLSLMIGLILVPSAMAMAAQTAPPTQRFTLNDCLKLGFAYSPDIQTATKNVDVLQESVNQAKAALMPTLGYNVSHTGTDSSNYNSGSLTLDLPLFTHNKLANNLKATQLQLEKTREDERQTRLELTYKIKNVFYDLWLKEQELAVAQASYDNLGEHYQTVKKYCEVGKKAEFELLEAEVAWKQQKAKVTSAQSNVLIAKLTLATLIGIDRDQDFEIIDDAALQQVPDQFTKDLKTLLNQAEKERPDLRQAARDIQIAELNVAITKASNYPSVSFSGGENDLNKEFQWTFGISGTLYDNHATASKVKAALQKVDLAKISEIKVQNSMRETVQKVYQNTQVDLENAAAYKANIDLTKEDLRLTEIRYKAGMSTILDVRDRQLDLDNAKNNYYQAVASYMTDLAQLDMELGNE
ncbi:MAG TPA: TolC family protein [Bacillota bacterium]|nr:TolC family protein [Bacillota bacterium]